MPLNINKSNQKDKLASSDINRNLKNIKKDKYIHVKIFAVIVVLLLGWLVYNLITLPPRPPVNTVNGETTHKKDSSELPNKIIDNRPIIKQNEIRVISVSASDLTSLRNKLGEKSALLMASGEYTPENVSLNPVKNSFYCKLVKKRSGFIKLSLVWGPSGNCESCDNSINKNPGSIALISKENGGIQYQVTAISK
jgi:hypothetical protein